MMTVARFIANQSRRHEGNYRKLMGLQQWDRPMLQIPGSDHSLMIGPYMVSRPYPISTKGLRELLAFVDQHGLKITINGSSSWHPDTVTVKVYKREYVEEFHAAAEQYGDAFYSSVLVAIYYRIHGSMWRVKRPSFSRSSVETGVFILATDTGGRKSHRATIENQLSPIAPYIIERG